MLHIFIMQHNYFDINHRSIHTYTCLPSSTHLKISLQEQSLNVAKPGFIFPTGTAFSIRGTSALLFHRKAIMMAPLIPVTDFVCFHISTHC